MVIAVSQGATDLMNGVIGSSAYDVGMWVVHREHGDENTGLSVNGGAYDSLSKADKWGERKEGCGALNLSF